MFSQFFDASGMIPYRRLPQERLVSELSALSLSGGDGGAEAPLDSLLASAAEPGGGGKSSVRQASHLIILSYLQNRTRSIQ